MALQKYALIAVLFTQFLFSTEVKGEEKLADPVTASYLLGWSKLLPPGKSAKRVVNTDMDRIESLKGGYSLNTTIDFKAVSVRLVIDGRVQDETTGEVFGTGRLYHPDFAISSQILCLYSEPNLGFLRVDYSCIVVGKTLQAIGLQVSGNKVEGRYATGVAVNDLAARFVMAAYPVSGLKTEGAGSIPGIVYQSDYELVSWPKLADNVTYCLDVTDEAGTPYQGLQSVKCGEDLFSFSPLEYVQDIYKRVIAKGTVFWWKVWSQEVGKDFAFNGEGYYGRVVVR